MAGHSMRRAVASRAAETCHGTAVRQPTRMTVTGMVAGPNRETMAKQPVRMADVRMEVETHQQTVVMAMACGTAMSTAAEEDRGKTEDIRAAG